MTDKQFEKLLKKCNKIARQHLDLMNECGKECERRFGVHYSDVDCDPIIDALKMGTNGISLTSFYYHMKAYSYVEPIITIKPDIL